MERANAKNKIISKVCRLVLSEYVRIFPSFLSRFETSGSLTDSCDLSGQNQSTHTGHTGWTGRAMTAIFFEAARQRDTGLVDVLALSFFLSFCYLPAQKEMARKEK